MSEPASRRRLPRFSLRSLILLIILISSGTGLWYRWEPWVRLYALDGHGGHAVLLASFSPDDSSILTAGWGGRLCIWNPSTGKLRRSFEHDKKIDKAFYSRNGSYILVINENGTYVRDGGTGELRFKIDQMKSNASYWLSDSERYLVFVYSRQSMRVNKMQTMPGAPEEHTIYVWELTKGKCVQVLRGHTRNVRSVCFSSDEEAMLSGSDDRYVREWDLRTGTSTLTLDFGEQVLTAMYLKNDSQIAVIGHGAARQVFDRRSGSAVSDRRGRLNSTGEALPFPSEDEQWAARHYHQAHQSDLTSTGRLWIYVPGNTSPPFIFHRRHPAQWYGVAWLPEFWLTVALGVGLMFSLWRDSRIMRA